MTVIDLAAARAARQCTDPTPAARGVRPAPQNRDEVWRKAERLLDYIKALQTLALTASSAAKWGHQVPSWQCVLFDEQFELLIDELRRAEAALLLTPVPTRSALNWKRRRLARGIQYLPIEAADVERAIATDEQWLATDPHNRARAVQTRKARRHASQ